VPWQSKRADTPCRTIGGVLAGGIHRSGRLRTTKGKSVWAKRLVRRWRRCRGGLYLNPAAPAGCRIQGCAQNGQGLYNKQAGRGLHGDVIFNAGRRSLMVASTFNSQSHTRNRSHRLGFPRERSPKVPIYTGKAGSAHICPGKRVATNCSLGYGQSGEGATVKTHQP